jgi:hypothetical protein
MPHPCHRRRRLICGLAATAATGGRAADGDQPRIVSLSVHGARIEVQFEPGFSPALQAQALVWVTDAAAAVAAYFGRFPLPRAELLLQAAAGAGVRGGSTFPEPAPWVRVRLGVQTDAAGFRADWVLVHEFIHLAIPQLPRGQNWLHEGIATYVEGVSRGRAGLEAPAAVWAGWQRGMPQGLPQPGDRGLDHTPTWGRTYWGGALWCLLADIRLLQRSGGRLGLQQALRGVLAAGGSYAQAWPVPRILAAADAAVGQDSLSAMYAEWKDQPVAVDLPALWRDLGVHGDSRRDDAPLAAIRRAILP